jgi:hypothetical protein
MIFDIDAQVIVGDTIDLSPFVISYTRTQSMCNISHTGTVRLSPNVLQYLDLNNIDVQVYQDFRIIEYGQTVLTGYVSKIDKVRNPATTVSLVFSDKYKRAKDYYIDDPDFHTNNETLGAMFLYLVGLAGLDGVVDSPELNSLVLPPGQPLGLNTVDGAIALIVGYGSAAIYTDGNGVVHLRKGGQGSDLQFSTGPTIPDQPATPMEITQGNVMAGSYVLSDENARDTVSVWGYGIANPYNQEIQDTRIVSNRYKDLGLPVAKTAVYSSSLIQTQQEADRLASEMINELGKLEETITVDCQGDPRVTVLKKAPVNINLETITFSAIKNITTVVGNLSAEGYTMVVTFDEFCPKFAGWSLAQVPLIIYAGTTRFGVYKSLDGGHTWFEYNAGLPTTPKYVAALATTEMDEVMALINGQIWYTTTSGFTTSGLWVRKSPFGEVPTLEPSYRSAGRYITVTSSGQTSGCFNVLMSAARYRDIISGQWYDPRPECRSWVYSTSNAGHSWTGTLIADGSDRSFYGTAMSSRYSVPYVLTNRGAQDVPAPYPARVEKGPMERYAYYSAYTGQGSVWHTTVSNPMEMGVRDFDLYTDYRPGMYGPVTGGDALYYQRRIGWPIYCIMQKPFDPSYELAGLACHYQYSIYDCPSFTPLSEFAMSDMYGEFGYRNWAGSLLIGVWYQGTYPFTGYDQVHGNVQLTTQAQQYITCAEWGILGEPGLYGDGEAGSVGLSFIATYFHTIPGQTEKNRLQVTTGCRRYVPETSDVNYITFSAGTLFWDFLGGSA